MLPFTVLAGVPRLTGSTLVASISKALTGGGEPGRKKKTQTGSYVIGQKHGSLPTEPSNSV